MEKKIEDFLHLYLGCKGMIPSEVISKEPYITTIDCDIISNVLCVPNGIFSGIKPILRRWTDKTADEILKTGRIEFINGRACYNTDQFKYLLSKHFDLFQLIESGLAIDATKLTGWQFGWDNEGPLPETRILGT